MKPLDQSRARRLRGQGPAGPAAGALLPAGLDPDKVDERDVIDGVYYPSSDGKPMAETGIHVRAIILLFQALEDFFRDGPPVYISADQFWYWREGDASACCAPDVMVVPGVEYQEQRAFMSWLEGGAIPAVVFEMASKNTWKEDVREKYDLYERLGVKEYFIFDPEAKYLRPVLQGFRLRKKVYRPIRPDADGRLESKELGFCVQSERRVLRLIDTRTGSPILTRQERVEQGQRLTEEEKARADWERQRADELEAEVARLRALLEGKPGKGRPGRGK